MAGAKRLTEGDTRARPDGPRPGSRLRRDSALPSGEGSGATPAPLAPSEAIPARHVLVGEFGRAHGLAGEIRLKSYTADPLAIARYGPLAGPGGRSFTLSHVRPAAGDQPDLLVARVAGVTTREAAEALNRAGLHVARDRLPPAEEEDEFLLADLIGLEVVDAAGAPVGRVASVPNYGGGDLIEIAPADRRPTLLLPFTRAFVPTIDLSAGRIVVDLPDEDEADAPPGDAAP